MHSFFVPGSGGPAELVGLGAAGRPVSSSDGRHEVSSFRLLLVLWLQGLPFLQALIFIAGLAEKKQLLVVFPFGQVHSARGPARLDTLVLAVKNRPEVFKLALYVVDCRRTTEASQTPLETCALYLLRLHMSDLFR